MLFLLSNCQIVHIKSNVSADEYSGYGNLDANAVFDTCAISVLCFSFPAIISYHTMHPVKQ